jgi:hypothetical protein
MSCCFNLISVFCLGLHYTTIVITLSAGTMRQVGVILVYNIMHLTSWLVIKLDHEGRSVKIRNRMNCMTTIAKCKLSTSHRCSVQQYNVNSLPHASIVIVYHNEALSVLIRMLNSIFDRTPAVLIHEIILLDDYSVAGRSIAYCAFMTF